MIEMDKVFQKVDLYVHPSFGETLTVANLTGHPTICAPDGLDEKSKTPRSISFTGRLFGETQLAALAQAWQRSTRYHLAHPPL
jgi:Asp-tRNA(Asn)/Glu-tRNA(Gln) amidotransferase A subunit family amidase